MFRSELHRHTVERRRQCKRHPEALWTNRKRVRMIRFVTTTRSMLSVFRVYRRRVDLVSENTLGLRLGDREIEPSQQLNQGLALAAYQHSQAVVSVVRCGGDTPDGTEHADSDLAFFDQLRDVGQVQGTACGTLPDVVFAYAT